MKEEIIEAIERAATSLPDYIKEELKKAYRREKGIAKEQIKNILENVEIAEREKIPLCQDTGTITFYARIRERNLEALEKILRRAVLEATQKVPLRENVVSPLKRINTGNNVGKYLPTIYFEVSKKEEIIVHLRGAGSDNQTFLKIFPLTATKKDIEKWVGKCVLDKAKNACPPLIIGIGIGGVPDYTLKLSKKALINNNKMDGWEEKLLEKINKLGIGPMGLGGKTTALRVKIEKAHCHTASLPVALSFNCWALRIAKIDL